jgi:predicted PurR-regulated permease PerM
LTSLLIVSTKLHSRLPRLSSAWVLALVVLFGLIVYLLTTFLKSSRQMRATLRQQLGKEGYDDALRRAKALTRNFLTIMLGLGIALQFVLMYFTN